MPIISSDAHGHPRPERYVHPKMCNRLCRPIHLHTLIHQPQSPTPAPSLLRAPVALRLFANQDSLGHDLLYALLRTLPSSTGSVSLTGFPRGMELSYINRYGNQVRVSGGGDDGIELVFRNMDLVTLHNTIESLQVLSSPTDENYLIHLTVRSADDATVMGAFSVLVRVPQTAPIVIGQDVIQLLSGETAPLLLSVQGGTTDTEFTAITIQVGRDMTGQLLGHLQLAPGVALPELTFQDIGGGVYQIGSTATTAAGRQAALDNLFMVGGLVFESASSVSGVFPEGLSITGTTVTAEGKKSQYGTIYRHQISQRYLTK